MNSFKTALLLSALTGLFLAAGYLIGGNSGMMVALIVAAGLNFMAYWNGDKMVLSMHNAREVDRQMAPSFYDLVAKLSSRAQLPMPRLYIMDNPQPNAFATGRNPQHSAVAATTGLLQLLSYDEISGVLAHELAHIKNRDTLTMTITATIAGAISMLANFGFFFSGRDRNNPLGAVGSILMLILAPLTAMIVQMAISRAREYEADRSGAEISGQPLALASALDKISHSVETTPNETAEDNPATAHLFIINPLLGSGMDNLFSTHPNTQNRIKALQAMAEILTMQATPSTQQDYGPSSCEPEHPTGPWG